MKLLPLFLAGALSAGAPLAATAQNATWALSLNSPATTRITRVVTDASNHTYVSGFLTGAATFGPQAIPVGGAQLYNGFVARLDAQGGVEWVRYLAPAGSGIQTVVSGLVLDAAGNPVFCGSYRNGSLTLGTTALPQNATTSWGNGVVAKLDPAGNVLWAQPVAESNADLETSALDVDATGTAYVAVSTTVGNSFASGLGLRTFSAAGTPGPRYDFPGVTGTAADSPQGVFSSISDVAVNPTTGQVGIVGVFQGTLTLRAAGGAAPAITFTSPREPRRGAFIAGLDPTGAPQWAQELTCTGFSQNGTTGSFLNQLNDLAPAGTGFVAVGGYLGAGALAGTTLPGSAASDNLTAVLARFDGQGQLQWTRAVSGDGASGSGALARAVVTDAAGQIHAAGILLGHLAANGGSQTGSGDVDALLLRYSDQGQLLGTQRDGLYGSLNPYALALDPAGQPVIAGDILGTISLGGTVLASGSRPNGFVARLARTPLAARAASAAQAALQVFPTPSAGASALQVHLLPSAGPATLRLLNALGQQVHGQTVPARVAAATVPTAGLAPGRYVLQVVSGEGVATSGVVVD